MGTRGFIKDILFIFLAYNIFKIWMYKEQVGTGVIALTALISILVIWFMFERLGIFPKM